MANWRVAKSLDVILKQVNAQWPNRDKSSDGTIGDAAHAARASDHNPNAAGVVTARDITNDPAHGLVSRQLAESIIASKDERVKYIISNAQICSGTGQNQPAWVWRPYSGINAHRQHVHISVKGDPAHYDNTALWNITGGQTVTPPQPPTVPQPTARRILQQGDSGPDVVILQKALGIPADGEFGEVTDAAVKGFQAAAGLTADGVVGSATWAAVDELVKRLAAGSDGLTPEDKQAITAAAKASTIQTYDWDDRGHSPPGYIAGMGMCFAMALKRLAAGDAGALEMSRPAGNADVDALALYADEFAEHGMSNDVAGPQTLRHLFAFMIGHGMLESSGRYCEGRDLKAENVEAETAEAGLFQTSWNIKSASPNIPPLLDEFWNNPQGFLPVFAEGIEPKASEIGCYGTGNGARYQWLTKYSPAFHALVTAVGLRKNRSHWGPVKHMEVEIVPAADDFLRKVQDLVGGAVVVEPPAPVVPVGQAKVSIDIVVQGDVQLFINGVLWKG